MFQNIFYFCIFLISWYAMHIAFFPSEIIIPIGKNYTYSIKGGQTVVFRSSNLTTNFNESLKCILHTAHALGEIDILIYKIEIPYTHYIILNRTVTTYKALVGYFFPTEKIQHIGNKWEYLVIGCE